MNNQKSIELITQIRAIQILITWAWKSKRFFVTVELINPKDRINESGMMLQLRNEFHGKIPSLCWIKRVNITFA